MALDKAAIRQLSTQCKRALKKPLQFVYCPKGEDGEPVLIIDKNIKPQLGELKKTAQTKKFVQGTLKKSGKVLAFYPKTAPDKLGRDLKNTFAKKVPLLKGVQVITPDQAKAAAAAAGKEDPRLSALSAKIGKRAATFRSAPEGLSEARLQKLLESIEQYRSDGGKTDYSGLEKELERELGRRRSEGAEGRDVQPAAGTDSAALDEMQAQIGRLAARFRSNPQKPTLKQLRQLRDRIRAYEAAGGTTDFSLLRQELREEVTRRKSGQQAQASVELSALHDEISSSFTSFQTQRSEIEAALSQPENQTPEKRGALRQQLQSILDELIQKRDLLQSKLNN